MMTRLTELGGDEHHYYPKYKINANLLIENNKQFVDQVLKDLQKAIDIECEKFVEQES